jgi:hypothetical protein
LPGLVNETRALTRATVYGVLVLALCLGSCGSNGAPVVTGEVTAVQKMPFHGPGGPGTEPMSITFMWTVVVKATGASDCVVEAIHTEIREAQSGEAVEADATPSRVLPDGEPVELPQQQGGLFHSTLYSRPWSGQSQVTVGCAGGEHQEIGIAFTVP